MHCIITLILALLMVAAPLAESLEAQNRPDPRGAFIRSLAVPGWGHYYADKHNWNRGKVHLGAEVVMIASYAGLLHRSSAIEERYLTLASLRAGIDLDSRSRSIQLAVGNYQNLGEYNDFQLRSRNWNRLLHNTPENHWQWRHEDDKNRYNELRSDRDRIRNQLPGIIGLMAVNRVISAVSAFNRARNNADIPEISVSPVLNANGSSGAALNLMFRF